jgi:hypothetical protein
MKKLLNLLLIPTISIFVISCSTTQSPDLDAQTASFTHFKQKHSLVEVRKLILKAGKEEGWRMTEFKDNEVIAEKVSDGDTQAVSIKFSKNYFHITPPNDDLEDAIEEKLQE